MTKPQITKFNFMRKVALIFINDLRNNNESLIVKQLNEFATPEQMQIIKSNIQQIEPIKSIDISPDQFRNLRDFVSSGAKYPDLLPDGSVDYNSVVDFMTTLTNIYKWSI